MGRATDSEAGNDTLDRASSDPVTFSTHADPMDSDIASPTGLGARGWIRWMWSRLTSMRTALILLLFLGLFAIPGSVIPQRTSDPLKVNEFTAANPGLTPWLERFGLFDVYGSSWFSAVYLLLFLSLVGCLVPRAAQHWRMWRRGPTPPPRNVAQLPDTREVAGASGPLLALAEEELGRRRWRTRAGDGWVAAEKGFARETGNQIFHFALLGVLAAIGLGALLGWHGNVVVKEGGGFADTVTQYDTFVAGRFTQADSLPPFSVQLTDFDVAFERGEAQHGAPRDFDASVTVIDEPGAVPRQVSLGVNEPVEVDGAKMFLIGHGYAPHVIVRDRTGAVVFDDTVVFLPQDSNFSSAGVVKVPDAKPQVGLRGIFLPTAALDPVAGPISTFPAPDDPALFLSAFTGDLGLDSGTPQSVYTLNSDQMTQRGLKALRPGESWRVPGGGSVEFAGYDRWISVKVAHDPGGGWALAFVALAIAGLSCSLFIRRRRVWVVAGEAGVTVGGVGRGESTSVAVEVDGLVTAMEHRGSSSTTKGGVAP